MKDIGYWMLELEKTDHCPHLEWEGIPEVDATCKQCGIDEVELGSQRIRREELLVRMLQNAQ